MLLVIEAVLAKDEIDTFRRALDAEGWRDGRATAGTLARLQKQNEQIDERNETGKRLGDRIIDKLTAHPRFLSAALPARIHPPRFNRYRDGGRYGVHVDAAVMPFAGAAPLLRADVSATLFLTDPGAYDGGVLEIEGPFGAQQVKLSAGDLVVYPSDSLHQVTPVTRGERVSAFFWVQSIVCDPAERALLFDLDQSIQGLRARHGDDLPEVIRLTAIYNNLLRRWAAV